ncbi:MAG: hypothetical protein ACI9UU_002480 [Candidatus Azotimanducaceae bacterium]|jgi:hypothetical protein
MKVISKFGHLLASLVLIVMAGLQFNDPDPSFWVAMYGIAAMMPIATLLGRRLPTIFYIAGGMLLAGLLISLPGFIDYLDSGDFGAIGGEMTASKPYVESAREFLGTAIAAFVLGFYWQGHTDD